MTSPTTHDLVLQGISALERTPSGRSAGDRGQHSGYPWIDPSEWTPPAKVQENAAMGIALRAYAEETLGRSRPGGTDIGVARAVQLSLGGTVWPRSIKRMSSYFARHVNDRNAPGWEDYANPSPGYVAWLLWGGDEGLAWALHLKELMKYAPSLVANPMNELERIAQEHEQALESASALLKAHSLIALGSGKYESYFMLHPSTTIDGGWQVSFFDRRGPYGHAEDEDLDKVVSRALEDNSLEEVRPLSEAEFIAVSSTPEFRKGVKQVTYTGLLNSLTYEFENAKTQDIIEAAYAAKDIDEAIEILLRGLSMLRARHTPRRNPERDGVDYWLEQRPGLWILSNIEIPKHLRNEGVGSEFMSWLTAEADAAGVTLALSPSTDFGASSKSRLVRFYRRFGFVPNKGRNRDFTVSETMYRRPQ